MHGELINKRKRMYTTCALNVLNQYPRDILSKIFELLPPFQKQFKLILSCNALSLLTLSCQLPSCFFFCIQHLTDCTNGGKFKSCVNFGTSCTCQNFLYSKHNEEQRVLFKLFEKSEQKTATFDFSSLPVNF